MTDFDFDNLATADAADDDLVRTLRNAIKAANSKVKELEKENKGYRAEKRTASLDDLLKAQGVNPKVSRFFPADTEPTEDAVKAWLTENSDLFPTGASGNASESGGNATGEGAAVDPATVAAFQAAQKAESAGEPSVLVGLEKQRADLAALRGRGSEAVIKFMQEHGYASS